MMSRIIVKNLPNKVTDKKLKAIFGEKGTVTDVQLKYTVKGEFRRFGFIGYKTAEEAEAAKEAFDKTFINASQISVELCAALDDPTKPKAWSKHAAERITAKENKPKLKKEEAPVSKKKKGKIKDAKVVELLENHKGDALFREFMETHLTSSSDILPENEAVKEEEEDVRDADKKISDLEYLKSKTIQSSDERDHKNINKVFDRDRITLKVSNLPLKTVKKDLKAFFRPAKITSVRIPTKVKGFAYCDFDTEAEMKKALVKHRSFLGTKRIIVKVFKKETANDFHKFKRDREEEKMKGIEAVGETGRIFVRNLSYTVVEDDLRPLFDKFGPVTELTLPVDPLTRQPKGFGFVTFLIPEHAVRALNELDGTVLHGRMLHLLPSLPKEEADDDDLTGLNYKEKKLKKQKQMANNTVNWNTFFINDNCLAEAMADTYKTTKQQVLSEERGGAAVRLALGETELVQKTKNFLVQNGVLLSAFENMGDAHRSENVILVKNLPYKTDITEIRERFAKMGELSNVLMSPYGGTAIVEFVAASEAKMAFKRLAYSRFKHMPLYLEWAPKNIFDGRKTNVKVDKEEENVNSGKEQQNNSNDGEKMDVDDNSEKTQDKPVIVKKIEGNHIPIEGATLYVKGINFNTVPEALKQHFESCGDVVHVLIAEKRDPNKPGVKLSMGYGFVEFADVKSADKALKTLQHSSLDGHMLELKRSNRTTNITQATKAQVKKGKPSTKIMVRNIPFQATQREIESLFKVFGEIKALRLPKKMVGTGPHRGFCFVDFHTVHDAKRAFKALSESTHLYGRRLVLEWAEAEDDVDTLRQKTAKSFANSGKGEKRKKVEIEDNVEEDS